MKISSPHPRRLPTDDEVEHSIAVAEGLDAEIHKIKNKILDLQKQIDAIEERKRNYLSFISPIRCLPPELIIEICLACVEEGVSPFILSQICGRFREVINDTGELWSRIHVTDGRMLYAFEQEPNFPEFALSIGGRDLMALVLQRAKSAPLKMIWELPFTYEILDIIRPHSHHVHSLGLVCRYDYHERNFDGSPLSTCNLNSLQHVSLEGESWTVPIYLPFLSGLKLGELILEITMSIEVSCWFTRTSVWEHITALIVHSGLYLLEKDYPARITMQSLKFLTVWGTPSFLEFVTLPSLIYLQLSADSSTRLSGRDIPHHLETLKTKNINIGLKNAEMAVLFHNIREFEGVTTTIICETEGTFSLPEVQDLHIEELSLGNEEQINYFMDPLSILDTHGRLESLHSLHVKGMAIRGSTIDTLQMLKGLVKLIIEACHFLDDSSDRLRDMLMAHNRGSIFPNLQFLRIEYPQDIMGDLLAERSGTWPAFNM